MNILIIGNGFDLAHGLPTTYKNFLDFACIFKQYYYKESNKEQFRCGEKYENYKNYIIELFEKSLQNEQEGSLFEELGKLIIDNRWLEYFGKINKDGGWIDFESEISKVVQTLDKVRKSRDEEVKSDPEIKEFTLEKYDQNILKEIGIKSLKMGVGEVEKIKNSLLDDLNKLIRCLEIYLDDYVGRVTLQVKLPDITEQTIHHVLSFNYTDTFERLYAQDQSEVIDYDYIHGKINPNSSVETCNLVLGIDEYLVGEAKRRDNEYIQFKKFYQRIYKKTGCKYVNWVKNVKRFPQGYESFSNNIYILGHSLDVTDGDIISSLINMPDTKTTIFYHSQEALGNQINNLVKIIGEEELIRKVHGADASIVLQKQQEPIKIES